MLSSQVAAVYLDNVAEHGLNEAGPIPRREEIAVQWSDVALQCQCVMGERTTIIGNKMYTILWHGDNYMEQQLLQ